MSKLKNLIDRLCPDGVKFKSLGEVAFIPNDRINIKRVPNGLYIGVENLLKDKLGMIPAEEMPAVHEVIKFIKNDVLIGNIRPYLKKIWLADKDGGTNGDVVVIRIKDKNIIPAFLYYILSSDDFFFFMNQYSKGAKMPRGDKKKILEYSIPMPPIEVQEEIVRILDTFSAHAAELQAELQARKEQYEYYRNLLLTFNPSACGCGTDGKQKIKDVNTHPTGSYEIHWKTMEEIFEMRNGYTPSKNNPTFWEDGNIPWFRMEDIRDNGRILSDAIQHITPAAIKGKGLFEANSFILATTATIGEHALLIADSLANQQFTNLKVRKSLSDKFITKFIYYYMFIVDEFCKNNTNVSGFASVDMGKLKRMPFPIPPIELQEKIVAILDRFETLVNDLTTGLPAEIAAVKEQYEYYRNKLLTFKQIPA